jgi:hypothetical protein
MLSLPKDNRSFSSAKPKSLFVFSEKMGVCCMYLKHIVHCVANCRMLVLERLNQTT